MKKLILTTVCAAATLTGFAQGTIQFQNGNTSPIYVSTNLSTSQPVGNKATSGTIAQQPGSTSSSSGVIDIALLWGTTAGTVTNIAGVVNMSATAGVIAGNNNFAVNGTAPGDVDWFEVVAWDSSYGNTMTGEAAAVAAGAYWGSPGATTYGVIGPALQFTLGPNPSPGTVIFGSPSSGAGFFHLFTLTTSPEPGTIALGGLGAAALLFFRRRK